MTTELPAPSRPGPALRISVPRPYRSASFGRFLADEAGSAVLLLAATVVALVWANLPGDGYEAFWSTEVSLRVGDWTADLDLRHVVNDALISLFFVVVGLEISREVTVGELRNRRRVIVPALGAVGGLVLPALVYLTFVGSGPAAAGWGIPVSTDTAFLIGVLALFGPRCPDQLRVFLLTLAIVDDIGAITVMAVFYTPSVSVPALVASGVLVLVLLGLRWVGVWQLAPYLLVGLALWCAVFASGVHATLAGVLVGLIVPATPVEEDQRDRLQFYGRALLERAEASRARLATAAARATVPANDRLQNDLHPLSAFLVVPLFGLANAGVRLDGESLSAAVTSSVTIGVVAALLLGNTLGISVGAGLALRSGWGQLPGRVRYGHLIGGAALSGIGFTIALFITEMAFTDEALRQEAKVGVLAGSLLAAVIGSLLLRYLGERLPLCTIEDDVEPPELPVGPWRDPTLA
ncbi:Na+/H+ antiporter NhaA [Geodermatophilus sp. URMC 64]